MDQSDPNLTSTMNAFSFLATAITDSMVNNKIVPSERRTECLTIGSGILMENTQEAIALMGNDDTARANACILVSDKILVPAYGEMHGPG